MSCPEPITLTLDSIKESANSDQSLVIYGTLPCKENNKTDLCFWRLFLMNSRKTRRSSIGIEPIRTGMHTLIFVTIRMKLKAEYVSNVIYKIEYIKIRSRLCCTPKTGRKLLTRKIYSNACTENYKSSQELGEDSIEYF